MAPGVYQILTSPIEMRRKPHKFADANENKCNK